MTTIAAKTKRIPAMGGNAIDAMRRTPIILITRRCALVVCNSRYVRRCKSRSSPACRFPGFGFCFLICHIVSSTNIN